MLLPLLVALMLAQSPESAPQGSAPAAPSDQAPSTPRKPRPKSPDRWSLDYEAGPMRLYRDAATGKAYWYAVFTIVNRTGADHDIAPRWEMMDDHGRILPEGREVPTEIYRAIGKLLNDPSLVDAASAVGPIGRGVENGRAGFVVFPVCGLEDRHFTMFVGGLSNERQESKQAPEDAKTGQPAMLRRTIRLDYRIPGDPAHLQGAVPLADAPAGETNPQWIFR